MTTTTRRRTALSLIVTVCLLGALGVPAQAVSSPDVFYVSPIGLDDHPGTLAAPWKSLKQALRRLTPGDTLYVRGGTYRENVGWGIVPGTSTAPIRVFAYPGERPVVKGTVYLSYAHYWTLRGINITRDPAAPVTQYLLKMSAGIGWQYLGAEIWGTKGVANVLVNSPVAGQPARWRLAGNCIHDNDATGHPYMNDHNIYLMPGYRSGPGVIERNLLFNAENGNNIKAAGPNKSTGAAYVTIRYNTMANAAQGVTVAYGTHHVTLERNLIGPRRGGRDWLPAIRGYAVSGLGNVARSNAAYRYRKVLLNTYGTSRIRDGGGNRFVTPDYNSTSSCSGFRPRNSTARAYGRHAH